MTKTQKNTLLCLVLIGLMYFCIFIAPNNTGAKNDIMLSVFEQDEFAEYPFVLRMLDSNLSFYQMIRHFIIYLFYYYGYPFFFFSALAILPIKWIIGAGWTAHTQLIVLVLRQLINVLPGILSAGILVYLQTRFKSIWKSLLLFIFLLTIPTLIFNNMWWHPDGLLLLFATLTLFFLDRDKFRFGRNFYIAAVFAGIATATKILGLFFFLAVGVYLLWGILQKKIAFKKAFLTGLLFIVIMAASILISFPVLLLPIERKEVFAAMQSGFSQLSFGFYEKSGSRKNLIEFISGFKYSYGAWYFLLLSIIVPVFGIIKNKNRLINVLILSWSAVHIVYFSFFTTVVKEYYFLPSLLPLFSCFGTLFLVTPSKAEGMEKRIVPAILTVCAAVIILFQSAIFIKTDVGSIQSQITREENSRNIQFFTTLNQKFLQGQLGERSLVIYRDWRIYLDPKPDWRVEYDWNFANYSYIEQHDPDLILIEFENAYYFSNKEVLENALNTDRAKPRYEFYDDAYREEIKGYHLLYKDQFGYAFLRDELYREYIQ